MAQLDVQPKQSKPFWIWVILVIIALALLFFFLKGCSNSSAPTALRTTESDSAETDTSKGTKLATTQPDWNAIDFNVPRSSYEEVTDTAIVVRGNEKYTVYGLGENVLFAEGDSTLQGSADPKLKIVASSLAKRFRNAPIGVYGHTDSSGGTDANKALGARRANAVKEWLIIKGGILADNISVRSMGEEKPVATNQTSQGRQQNRSVEIVAFPQGSAQ